MQESFTYFKIFKPISWDKRPAERRRRLIQRLLSLCCSDTFLLTLFTGSFANARSGYENLPKSEYGSLLKGCRILVIAVLLVYAISRIVGGGFKDFCEGAIWWVLIAIGLAASMTYLSQTEPNEDRKK